MGWGKPKKASGLSKRGVRSHPKKEMTKIQKRALTKIPKRVMTKIPKWVLTKIPKWAMTKISKRKWLTQVAEISKGKVSRPAQKGSG